MTDTNPEFVRAPELMLRINRLAREDAKRRGLITMEVGGHGQFQTTAGSLDRLMAEYAGYDVAALRTEIKDLVGDRYYEVSDITTRFACLMILAELKGLATN
jgi:hypothetical protein